MSEIRLALHGGAGDPAGGEHVEERAALRHIAEETLALLRGGASALSAVERAVQRLEECPLFNAGVGAVLNHRGEAELDAAIMDGRERRCGAVAGVRRTQSPVALARAVMERTPHVLLMGAEADAFARASGLTQVEPSHFVTERRLRQQQAALGRLALDHDAAFGTVGAVARDAQGHLAAATSTGGLTNKFPGRVGDTPIIGAGTFADDRSAAISCTGTGEAFIRAGFGFAVDLRLREQGLTLAHACELGLEEVRGYGGRGGCIAVDRRGELALPFNSRAMFRAWCGADGEIRVAVGET